MSIIRLIITITISSNLIGALIALFLPPQGFRPEGEIPRKHSSARILRKVLTVEIYSQYAIKNLDLLEHGPRGIGR